MSKKYLPTAVPAVPATRVIHYVDVASQPEVAPLSPIAMARRDHEYRMQYLAWRDRQEEIAFHDRKVRRFMLGFGVTVGLAVVGTLVGLVWYAVAALSFLGLLAIPAVVLLSGATVYGGHRCITIVQHLH